eukprot:3937610-Rhodomonas_salina.1
MRKRRHSVLLSSLQGSTFQDDSTAGGCACRSATRVQITQSQSLQIPSVAQPPVAPRNQIQETAFLPSRSFSSSPTSPDVNSSPDSITTP